MTLRQLDTLIAFTVLLICLGAAGVSGQGSRAQPTLGAAAALGEIAKLREEKARLEAMLLDRDRQVANIKYQLGKQVLELQADLDEARLNARAEPVLKVLRELVKPDPAALLDWRTGQFVKPAPKVEEKK